MSFRPEWRNLAFNYKDFSAEFTQSKVEVVEMTKALRIS